jgi:hypothetical protein
VWANDWFDVGLACVILGLLLAVLGLYLHFRREVPVLTMQEAAPPMEAGTPSPANQQSQVPSGVATVDPADWIATYDETEDHRNLLFMLRHRFDNLGAIRAFSESRCTVTDPGGVTTTATGTQLIYQYIPYYFPGAPPVRSGTYRFAWEGRDAKGPWREITQGSHQIQVPAFIVKIMDDSQFENWQYIAMIAALHVQVENTTDTDIPVAGYAYTCDTGGQPPWDHQASAEERMSITREIARRQDRQEHGQPNRNYARIPGRTRIDAWLLVPMTRNPAGGTLPCTITVMDDIGNRYQATLPGHEPQTYGS